MECTAGIKIMRKTTTLWVKVVWANNVGYTSFTCIELAQVRPALRITSNLTTKFRAKLCQVFL